jgi:hypothetical protein
MISIFFQGVEGYYAENPASRIKVVKKGKKPSWKLPRDKDFALKGGVYVGNEY